MLSPLCKLNIVIKFYCLLEFGKVQKSQQSLRLIVPMQFSLSALEIKGLVA
ncbi:hypothetical protein HMPREF3201_00689 [Megasphaera sp. MJR8396C]|nr:hypothetical protein HMPREF3201_00689 [Megasphaera sp. MJR8396C]